MVEAHEHGPALGIGGQRAAHAARIDANALPGPTARQVNSGARQRRICEMQCHGIGNSKALWAAMSRLNHVIYRQAQAVAQQSRGAAHAEFLRGHEGVAAARHELQ